MYDYLVINDYVYWYADWPIIAVIVDSLDNNKRTNRQIEASLEQAKWMIESWIVFG